MVQINDQVLGAISLDLGINGQVPGANLEGLIASVAQISDYRVRYRILNETVTPAGGAGDVGFIYLASDREDERWKVIQLSLQNLTLRSPNVDLALADTSGINYTRRISTQLVRTMSFVTLVGAAAMGAENIAGTPSEGEIPEFVWVPAGEDFRVTVRPSSPFNVASLVLNGLVEVHPPETLLSLKDATQLIVPGP